MRKGKGKKKTTIVTTKNPAHKTAGQPGFKHLKGGKKVGSHSTRKHHTKHKGYSMKNIIKGQMTYKRKGRKR